ncbi:hypothetical protein QCA50_004941 [Cerrena zonata]|uniref:Uncharacterized protein n=1 Tax=Cerrena zonata TaxID=2478898 RepID=A0AAW0GNT0_9APHY
MARWVSKSNQDQYIHNHSQDHSCFSFYLIGTELVSSDPVRTLRNKQMHVPTRCIDDNLAIISPLCLTTAGVSPLPRMSYFRVHRFTLYPAIHSLPPIPLFDEARLPHIAYVLHRSVEAS